MPFRFVSLQSGSFHIYRAPSPLFISVPFIILGAAPRLTPGAWLLFEHGYDQGEASRELLAAAGFSEVQTWRDLAGIERVSGGRKAS